MCAESSTNIQMAISLDIRLRQLNGPQRTKVDIYKHSTSISADRCRSRILLKEGHTGLRGDCTQCPKCVKHTVCSAKYELARGQGDNLQNQVFKTCKFYHVISLNSQCKSKQITAEREGISPCPLFPTGSTIEIFHEISYQEPNHSNLSSTHLNLWICMICYKSFEHGMFY